MAEGCSLKDDDAVLKSMTADLSWLPRVCLYCQAPAESVLDDYDDGDDIDADGTQVIQFICRNCGEIVRVRTPFRYYGDMLTKVRKLHENQKALERTGRTLRSLSG